MKEKLQAATSTFLADLKTWGIAARKPEDVVHHALWQASMVAVKGST